MTSARTPRHFVAKRAVAPDHEPTRDEAREMAGQIVGRAIKIGRYDLAAATGALFDAEDALAAGAADRALAHIVEAKLVLEMWRKQL